MSLNEPPGTYKSASEVKRDYYIQLANVWYAKSTPRQRKRLAKHDVLVFDVMRGLANG